MRRSTFFSIPRAVGILLAVVFLTAVCSCGARGNGRGVWYPMEYGKYIALP